MRRTGSQGGPKDSADEVNTHGRCGGMEEAEGRLKAAN